MKLTPQEQASRERLRLEKPAVYAKIMAFKDEKSNAIIQLQYSYLCNFYCSHCSIAGFRKEDGKTLDLETVKRVMDEADAYGLATIAISGGEPLAFKELPDLIAAIGPSRFHIQVDTNGWLATPELMLELKNLGVDKIQISVDGVDPTTHDSFRHKEGSHARCLSAIAACQSAGLQVQVATVVDHERATSQELVDFLELIHGLGAAVSVVYAKPVGEWAGRTDLLCTKQDISHVKKLLKQYGGYDHTTPAYGKNLGCIAVKRMIAITAFGDVLPCPWMYWSIGNVHEKPLAEILGKGMEYFKERSPVCRLSEDPEFNKKYTSKVKPDGPLQSIEEIMGEL